MAPEPIRNPVKAEIESGTTRGNCEMPPTPAKGSWWCPGCGVIYRAFAGFWYREGACV